MGSKIGAQSTLYCPPSSEGVFDASARSRGSSISSGWPLTTTCWITDGLTPRTDSPRSHAAICSFVSWPRTWTARRRNGSGCSIPNNKAFCAPNPRAAASNEARNALSSPSSPDSTASSSFIAPRSCEKSRPGGGEAGALILLA